MAKSLMKKSLKNKEDPYLSLLYHRNTPQEGIEATPAQRLMGRRTQTLLPTVPSLLQPVTVSTGNVMQQREDKQCKMANKFAHRRELRDSLIDGTTAVEWCVRVCCPVLPL